jgi:hypothetical protein
MAGLWLSSFNEHSPSERDTLFLSLIVHIGLINLTLLVARRSQRDPSPPPPRHTHAIILFIADVKLYQLQAFYYRLGTWALMLLSRLLLNENGNMPIYIKKHSLHTHTHTNTLMQRRDGRVKEREGYLARICLWEPCLSRRPTGQTECAL